MPQVVSARRHAVRKTRSELSEYDPIRCDPPLPAVDWAVNQDFGEYAEAQNTDDNPDN